MKLNKTISLFIRTYWPFAVLFILLFVQHIFFNAGYGDDAYFSKYPQRFDGSIWKACQNNYHSWSSRNVIEFFLMCMAGHNWLWRILDSVLMTLLALLIYKNCRMEGSLSKWVAASLVLLYPYLVLCNAGWITTTMNYSWTFILAMIAFTGARRLFEGRKISLIEYYLYFFCILYACSNEIMCVAHLSVYAVFACICVCQRKDSGLIFGYLTIALLELIWFLTCPGNDNRLMSETQNWFPAFAEMDILHKAGLGILYTMRELYIRTDLVFYTLCMLVPILSIVKKGMPLWKKILSCVPLLCTLIFPFIHYPLDIKNFQWQDFSVWFFALISCLASLILLFSIYSAMGNKKRALFLIFLLLIGVGSKIGMGFSPTIFVSGFRTSTLMIGLFIVAIAMLYNELYLTSKKSIRTIAGMIIILLALANFTKTFFGTYHDFFTY